MVRNNNSNGILRKKSILFICLLFALCSTAGFGQKQKPKNDSWYDDKWMHFGFSLGMNFMDLNITPSKAPLGSGSDKWLNPAVSILNPGINIQIVTNLRISKYFDLRFLPGVSFGQRNIKFFEISDSTGKDEVAETYNDKQRIESSFLEFPFSLKYKGDRLNNVRPYLIAGINYRYDLAGKKEYDDEKPIYIRLKRSDFYYEVGAGFDFYLPYFKLSIELKMSNGLRDVLVHEPAPKHPEFVNAIEKMKSQIWILAFHFE